MKTFAAAGQALVLMAFVPAYSWFASRVDRMNLIVGVTLFFVANILAFAFAVHAGVPFVGVAFYVWVGFFSLSIIAQFWSYANDIYTKDAGNRLFRSSASARPPAARSGRGSPGASSTPT